MIEIKAEFGSVLRQLDGLQKAVGDRVIARTLNRIGDGTKTQATREIASEFNITQAKVRERILVRKAFAKAGKLTVTVEVQGRGKKRSLNLIEFVEKSTSFAEARKRRKAGTLGQLYVKVTRKGAKKPLGKYAFIGNKGRTVFTRRQASGAVSGRLPIRPLQVIDVGQMFNAKRVNSRLLANIRAKFPVEFERQLSYELRRIGFR